MTVRMVKTLSLRALASLVLLSSGHSSFAQIALPDDVMHACPAKNFYTWLSDEGGVDSPPDPLSFPPNNPQNPTCEFYKIAERMFMWLTAPAQDYGKDRYVFDSSRFDQVSPPIEKKQLELTVNALNSIKTAIVGISQTDSDGDPIAIDGSRKVWKLRPVRRADSRGDQRIRTIDISGVSFRVDRSGGVLIADKPGEEAGILMAQRNGLVYYTIEVNDVYAFFLSGVKPPLSKIAQTHFPICECELQDVERAVGKQLAAPRMLAIEMKFAWVEADRLEEPKNYILSWAKIPTYKRQEETHWIENGWKHARLALVGMHIAFGTKGNKALIWTTFEHIRNAPNVPYSYEDTKAQMCHYPRSPNDKCGSLPAPQGESWLFSVHTCGVGENVRRMYLSGRNIEAYPGKTIGPSNVVRCAPWGANAASGVTQNTNVISINASVRHQLSTSDVRRNYVMIGTIWDRSGSGDGPNIGSLDTANTTMETFYQPSSCMNCHNGVPASNGNENMLGNGRGGGVSHIWDATQPLSFR